MRRLIIILCFVSVLFLLASLFIKPLIIILAKKQLGNTFVQSRISVGGCVLQPRRGLSLCDIEIKRPGVYDIKVKEAAVQCNLISILKPSPLKLTLKGTGVYLNTPKKGIRELAGYLNLGRGAPIFKSAEVADLTLDLNTLDLTAKATLSSGFNIATPSLDYLNFKMDIFKILGVQLEDCFLKLDPDSEQGDFGIAKLKYNKFRVTDTKGRVKLADRGLSLYGVSARTLDGVIQYDLELTLEKTAHYLVALRCVNLDIERFVRDFNFREKFDMTGRLNGNLKLKGQGAQIEILSGSLSTLPPGGTLAIRDAKFLENMARSTRQPMDLLLESFKNYCYNTGLMSLSFEDGNIILKVELEGEAGKRNLNVILHDVIRLN